MDFKRLGRYEIRRKLGEGGMGQVYLGHDPGLQRDVALKILLPGVASDPERLARLQREAQVLATLEHPNIAAVYGLEAADDVQFVVMQLADGETLAERLAGGAFATDEVIPVALQLARGLEAAHERGIVHRDLKPANVMIAADGGVKILDFGLAKPVEADAPAGSRSPDLSASPTMLEATRAGVILGTAAYMSPEQARGRPVDKRTDIWAWGCVVYETLTGAPLFSGDTASDVIAAVLRQKRDLDALPPDTPPVLRRLLRRCLERDPAQRLRDIGEARIALEQPLETVPGEGTAAAAPRSRWISPLRIAAVVLATALGLVAGRWLTSEPEQPLLQLDIAPSGLQTGLVAPPVVSPDGRRVMYRADDRLWIRDLGRSSAREVPGTDGVEIPFWFPGSDEIGYVADGRLWTQRLDGGAPVAVADVPLLTSGAGAAWRTGGRILYSQGSSALLEVPARGGEVRPWLLPDEERQEAHFHGGIELPGGSFVYVRHTLGGTADTIAAVRDDDPIVVLTLEGEYLSNLAYSPDGALLFSRRGAGGDGVWAVPFDAAALAATGDPTMLVSGAGFPSLSADGSTLVYDPSQEAVLDGRMRIGLVDDLASSDSGITDFRQLTDYETFVRQGQRISPDGRELAFTLLTAGAADLWILDLDSGARRRLTDDDAFEGSPAWSVDGRWIYFSRNDVTVARIPADGSGSPEELGEGRMPAVVPGTDRLLVLRRSPGRGSGSDLWWLDARPGGATEPFLAGQNTFGAASASADGSLVAYASNESGAWEIFVEQLASRRRWQISRAGGQAPQWGPDGNLYFVDSTRTIHRMSVATAGDGPPTFGVPERVIQLTPVFGTADVTPVETADGIRFLTTEVEAVGAAGRLVVVLGADRLVREALER